MSRALRVLLSLQMAMIATFVSLALIEVIALRGMMLTYMHADDPSSGDSAAWGFIVLQPLILLFGTGLSLPIGWITFKRCSGWLQRRAV